MIGIIYGKDIKSAAEVRERAIGEDRALEEGVRAIVEDVRQNGDAALLHYTEKFDGASLSSLLVSPEEIEAALQKTEPALIQTMERAAENIRAFHARQKREGFLVSEENGVMLGQRVLALDRAGLYIPGGTASYPSSVLMNAIPAKIAGVRELALATPPQPDGSIAPPILAAAAIAGVDRIYKMGGAQAIAALAYGTETVRRVDKITGPGNIYVATAKRLVYGIVDIDMIAGPSEILIIADENADARFVAADLLAQAEHDKLAASILLTTSEALAEDVQKELALQLETLPRREIASSALHENGRIVVLETLDQAADMSNEIAPEHLELCVRDPFALMGRIRHAGSVFLGNYSPEALGDYCAGPNHTLPTNGAARFSSPLSVDDFVKKSSFIYYTREALGAIGQDVAAFARAEGLEAHARSALIR